MTALKGAEVEAFLRRPDSRYRVVLVYGPDAGLVSERLALLSRTLVEDPEDPFRLIRLEGDDIASDPLRLADEANTVPLFGGGRAVRVRAGSRNIAPALAPLLAAPPTDAVVLIEAGDLSPKNPLRSAVESAACAAAIPCYGDDIKDLPGLVERSLRDRGLEIDADARAALAALLGADRMASRSEIEKVALYAHGRGRVTLADVEAVAADTAAVNLDALVDAVFVGDSEGMDSVLRRCLEEGSDPGVLIGAALRHAFLLQKTRIAVENGMRASDAENAARLYFKRKPAFQRQNRIWSAAALDEAIARLGEAQATVRRSPRVAGAIVSRVFLGMASAAGRRS
jgi:DNA polymerase-3 subunit delta